VNAAPEAACGDVERKLNLALLVLCPSAGCRIYLLPDANLTHIWITCFDVEPAENVHFFVMNYLLGGVD
jgi:hypothetical protein